MTRSSLCNTTTRNCIFSLDTTRTTAQNPGNFSREFPSRGPLRKKRASFQKGQGEKRAVFAGMDCAMH